MNQLKKLIISILLILVIQLKKKADFDDKLKKLNKKVTSNKTKHVFVENELIELTKIVEASSKGITKILMSKYKILNCAKYFSSEIIQYLYQLKNILNI